MSRWPDVLFVAAFAACLGFAVFRLGEARGRELVAKTCVEVGLVELHGSVFSCQKVGTVE